MWHSYDDYLDAQDHYAGWALRQEQDYWQHQHEEWEWYCHEHGLYPLPDDFYFPDLQQYEQANRSHPD